MNKLFVPLGDYQEIIDTLGQWKILSGKSLFEKGGFTSTYGNILRKIRKLEKYNFLKSFPVNRNLKYLYLSKQGIELTNEDSSYEVNQETICHDIMTSLVLNSFLEDKRFYYARMFHKILVNKIYPDADILYRQGEVKQQLAFEIEITQKSVERVKRKFSLYALESPYDFAIFIFNKNSIFKTYQKFLEEMIKEVRNKIIICLNPTFTINNFKLEDSSFFLNGKECEINEILDNKSCISNAKLNSEKIMRSK